MFLIFTGHKNKPQVTHMIRQLSENLVSTVTANVKDEETFTYIVKSNAVAVVALNLTEEILKCIARVRK